MSVSRPVPGAPISGHVLAQSVNGTCQTCGASVLWVRDQTHGADGASWYPPLEVSPVKVPGVAGLVCVAVSSSGHAAAITPQMHVVHECPEEAVRAVLARVGSMGFYSVEVLRVPCPLANCLAAPGLMCLNSRREALPRPHGARVEQAELQFGGPAAD